MQALHVFMPRMNTWMCLASQICLQTHVLHTTVPALAVFHSYGVPQARKGTVILADVKR